MKAKCCWEARETSKGWRLALWDGNTRYPVRGMLLGSSSDVKRATSGLRVVFIQMRDSKEKELV